MNRNGAGDACEQDSDGDRYIDDTVIPYSRKTLCEPILQALLSQGLDLRLSKWLGVSPVGNSLVSLNDSNALTMFLRVLVRFLLKEDVAKMLSHHVLLKTGVECKLLQDARKMAFNQSEQRLYLVFQSCAFPRLPPVFVFPRFPALTSSPGWLLCSNGPVSSIVYFPTRGPRFYLSVY